MPDDDATTPTPSVRAILAAARRALDEEVSPGEWEVGDIGVLAHRAPGGAEPANARVLAAARSLLGHAIDAVETCVNPWCYGDDPGDRCQPCRDLISDILAATGLAGGGATDEEGRTDGQDR